VIVSVGGRQVDYVAQLQEAIAFRKPGDVVDVEVARKGGERRVVRIPLQRVPDQRTSASRANEGSGNARGDAHSTLPLLGITVAPLDNATARELELPGDVRGVVVMDVAESSPAAGRLATPQAGGPDVILSVEGTAVTSPESLRAALRATKPGEIVTLRVYNAPAKTRRIERVRVGTTSTR
jgi:serine protease Do